MEPKEIAIQPSTQIVTYSVTSEEIDKLAAEYNEVPTDLTVKANYEKCRMATSTIRGLRGDVEKRRKELKADALEWGKKVDGQAKAITERLLAIEGPFATAKKDFDTAAEIAKREALLAEERRVDGIADRIARIKALVNACISSSSSVISDVMFGISSTDIPCESWAMEFADKANVVIMETMAKLDELKTMKVAQELAAEREALAVAEREEAEKKRREEEDLARKLRDEEIEAERKKIAEERCVFEREKALFAAANAAKEKINSVNDAPTTTAAVQPVSPQPVSSAPSSDYLAAGNAISEFMKAPGYVKGLLDAIIAGNIPFIIFTGKLS